MGSRASARRAFISLVLVAALAGCGDGGATPSPAESPAVSTGSAPTPESSPTPSPLATAVPLPVMPPEMANNDAAGAEAATRYFVALADYSLSTLDMRQWELLTDDDCVFCDGISETVREAQAGNLARAGGELAVTLINNVEFRGDSNLFLVDAEIHQEAYTWKTGDGLVVEEAAASGRTLSFALQHSELGWRLLAAGTSEG